MRKLFNRFNDFYHTHCAASKDNAIPKSEYKDGKYSVTIHAVDRMNSRRITKGMLHVNLHTKPIFKTSVQYDTFNRPSYRQASKNKVVSVINPSNNNVVSVWKHSYNKIVKEKE